MERWTGAQRAFAIKAYFMNGDSYAAAFREFCSHYNISQPRDAPSVNLIKKWIKMFRETGSALDQPIPRPTPTVSTDENVRRVHDSTRAKPRRSVRKPSRKHRENGK